jgi:hypothetical protein
VDFFEVTRQGCVASSEYQRDAAFVCHATALAELQRLDLVCTKVDDEYHPSEQELMSIVFCWNDDLVSIEIEIEIVCSVHAFPQSQRRLAQPSSVPHPTKPCE